MAQTDLKDLETVFRVLGNENRLRLLNILAWPRTLAELQLAPTRGPGARRANMTRQAVTHHIAKLVALGLVAELPETQPGAGTRYLVRRGRLFEVMEQARLLGEVEVHGDLAEETRISDPASKRGSKEFKGPHLVLVKGAGTGRRFPFQDGDIGRDPEAAVPLDYDPWVSHRHARLIRDGRRGLLQALPTGRNGTFLNDERMDPTQPVRLSSGDIIHIGLSTLVFRS